MRILHLFALLSIDGFWPTGSRWMVSLLPLTWYSTQNDEWRKCRKQESKSTFVRSYLGSVVIDPHRNCTFCPSLLSTNNFRMFFIGILWFFFLFFTHTLSFSYSLSLSLLFQSLCSSFISLWSHQNFNPVYCKGILLNCLWYKSLVWPWVSLLINKQNSSRIQYLTLNQIIFQLTI